MRITPALDVVEFSEGDRCPATAAENDGRPARPNPMRSSLSVHGCLRRPGRTCRHAQPLDRCQVWAVLVHHGTVGSRVGRAVVQGGGGGVPPAQDPGRGRHRRSQSPVDELSGLGQRSGAGTRRGRSTGPSECGRFHLQAGPFRDAGQQIPHPGVVEGVAHHRDTLTEIETEHLESHETRSSHDEQRTTLSVCSRYHT